MFHFKLLVNTQNQKTVYCFDTKTSPVLNLRTVWTYILNPRKSTNPFGAQLLPSQWKYVVLFICFNLYFNCFQHSEVCMITKLMLNNLWTEVDPDLLSSISSLFFIFLFLVLFPSFQILFSYHFNCQLFKIIKIEIWKGMFLSF